MLLSKTEKKIVSESRTLSRWFQVKIEIRVFGKLIWSYVWPPESNNLSDYVEESV